MKNRACLFALLLPLFIPAFADDDDTRMLRDGVQRQIRQYQEAEAFSDGLLHLGSVFCRHASRHAKKTKLC